MRNTLRKHRRSRGRHGYVLLAVLVGLIVAAMVLGSLARLSFQQANEALDRGTQLQLRWAAISCERTLLPQAERLLGEAEEVALALRQQPPSRLDFQVRLGEVTVEGTLQDENARVNLNSVFHFRGARAVEALVKQQASGQGLPAIRLRPLTRRVDPARANEDGVTLPIAFRSWGQIFDLERSRPTLVAERSSALRALPMWTRSLTLAENSVLNARRADDDVLRETCRLVVSDGVAGRIVRQYRENPQQDILTVINRVGVEPAERASLQKLLRDQSACYSIRMTLVTSHREEQRYVLAERDEEGVFRTRSQ